MTGYFLILLGKCYILKSKFSKSLPSNKQFITEIENYIKSVKYEN